MINVNLLADSRLKAPHEMRSWETIYQFSCFKSGPSWSSTAFQDNILDNQNVELARGLEIFLFIYGEPGV